MMIQRLKSCLQVEKVVYRLNVISVLEGLKLISSRHYKVCNVFELSTAYRFVEFVEVGASVFRGSVPGIRTILRTFRTEIDISGKTSRLDWYYQAYLELKQSLPPQVTERLADLSRVEIELVIGDQEKARSERSSLRRRFEELTIHFRTGEAPTYKSAKAKLESEIIKFMDKHGLEYRYEELERSSLLELSNLRDVETSLRHFTTLDISGVTLTNREDGEPMLVTAREPNQYKTELARTRNLENLRSSGVFDYLESLTTLSPNTRSP